MERIFKTLQEIWWLGQDALFKREYHLAKERTKKKRLKQSVEGMKYEKSKQVKK